MSMTIARTPAGVPTGGEFASRRRAEPDVSLPAFDLAPTTNEPSLGKWTVFEAVQKKVETFGLYQLPTGGQDVDRERLRMVVQASNTYDRDDAERTASELAEAEEKMTLLVLGGDGNVYAYEVTGSPLGYLRKGSKTHGWRHGELDILDVEEGFGGQHELAGRFEQALHRG